MRLQVSGSVRAHRVQRYDARHGEFGLAGFFDVQDFTAFVVSALGDRHGAASCARGSWGTRSSGWVLSASWSASGCGVPFRVSPFWIRHRVPLYFNLNFLNQRSSFLPRISFSADQRGSSTGPAHTLPGSGSGHSAGTNPYSCRGRSPSREEPARPALVQHLPAATRHPDNS